jgi:hypothetical protein
MTFDDPAIRAAYRRGARDAHDSAMMTNGPPDARAIDEWLDDLDRWDKGEPPPAPGHWRQ